MKALDDAIIDVRTSFMHRMLSLKGIRVDRQVVRSLVVRMSDHEIVEKLERESARWWTLKYWGF